MSETELQSIALKAISYYAALHPRPAQVTMKQGAEMLGCGIRKFKSLMAYHKVKLNKCGLIPITEIDRLLAVE